MAQSATALLNQLEALQRAEPEGFESKASTLLLDALRSLPKENPLHSALVAAHEYLLEDGDVDACLAELREAAMGES